MLLENTMIMQISNLYTVAYLYASACPTITKKWLVQEYKELYEEVH